MLIIKSIKIKCFYPTRILNEHWCIYSCLQIPPRENLFQHVRRVYETAINFPYITTLHFSILFSNYYVIKILIPTKCWTEAYANIELAPLVFALNVVTIHHFADQWPPKKLAYVLKLSPHFLLIIYMKIFINCIQLLHRRVKRILIFKG